MKRLLVLRPPPDDPSPPSPPALVQVHHVHDQFPNPALPMDNWAVRSGRWSDPATWAHGVPGPADRVVLHGDRDVLQDDPVAQVGALYLMDAAVLRHDATRDTTLTFGTIFLDDASSWLAHGATEADPIPAGVTCRLVRRDTPLPGPAVDPGQYTGGILCAGDSRVLLRGAPRTTDARDLRLAVEPLAGATTLTFATPPEGWRPGDTVVLPPTDPYHYGDAWCDDRGLDYRFEERTIASVAGAVVTLTAPLDRDHRGAHDPLDERPPILPHAMNVTRNVTIESANPAGTRGHLMLAERCDGRLHHVGIYHFGRTRGNALDSTTFAEDGSVLHYGTNQVGRYPLHRHHNFGPTNPADAGWQGETVGCAFVESRKWPIAIHGTSYNRVAACNVYLGEHSLVSLEQGNEAYNRIEGNLTFGATAPDTSDAWPVSDHYWLLQPGHNSLVDNVGAGGRGSAYLPHFIHLDGLRRGGGPADVADGMQNYPLHRGADVMHGVEGVDYERVTLNHTNFAEYARNECYAMTKGSSFDHFTGAPGAVLTLSDATCWNLGVEPVFMYGGYTEIVLDGLVSWGVRQYGLTLDAQGAPVTVRNADIRCVAGFDGSEPVGFLHQGGAAADQVFLLEDSRVHAPTGLLFYFPTSVGNGTDFGSYSRSDEVRNTTVTNPAGQAEPILIRLSATNGGTPTRVPALPARVVVRDWQGGPGDDFRLYWAEQAPGAILPDEASLAVLAGPGFSVYGGPEVGQTNAQALAAHGRCFGGEIIPDGAQGPDPEGFPGAYKYPIPPEEG